MTSFTVATEDQLSEVVAELLLAYSGRFNVAQRLRKNGFGYLKRQSRNFNEVEKHVMPVFLLTDLDNVPCPPALIADWLPDGPHRRLLFRVAVREVESWLMADRASIAEFLRAPLAKVPTTPDDLSDPKRTLLGLVRRYAGRALKRELLPADPATSLIGLGYNEQMSRFAREQWRCDQAAVASPSLARTLKRLKQFKP